MDLRFSIGVVFHIRHPIYAYQSRCQIPTPLRRRAIVRYGNLQDRVQLVEHNNTDDADQQYGKGE